MEQKCGSKNHPGTPPTPVGLQRLLDVANVEHEEARYVQQFAQDENVALMAFIAPYVAVRVSPVEETSASIGLPDEFGIEALIDLLLKADVKKAYLLVNSIGGSMSSSYKIARAIRTCLDDIVTYVPHIAASGATLIALTGNHIVMGPMSQLSPLDVMLPYKSSHVSASTFMRFFARASQWFQTTRPEEAPYPQRALADKLDPFLMEEWSGLMDTAASYVREILELTGYDDAEQITNRLVLTFPNHNYVITRDKAREIGLRVSQSEDCGEAWTVMRGWLGEYLFEEEITHCIRYALPSVGDIQSAPQQQEKDDATQS